MKIMRLAESAETVKARIESFLAQSEDAELSAMRVVRNSGDVDRRRTPGFLVDFFDYAFAHRSVG